MALPKFEDYKAPWEMDLKEDEDPKEKLDLDKLKRYMHGLLGDKEKAQAERDEVKTERDTLKSEKEAAAREGETEVDKLKRERDEAQDKLKKAEEGKGEKSPGELRLEVALEMGLTKTQAKRLVGTTEEELKKDAEELLESFGGAGDGDEDGAAGGPRTLPRKQLRNPADPAGTGGTGTAFDPEKEADAYVGQSLFS